MSDVDDRAKLIWRLAPSGVAATLTATGNSGGYTPGVNLCTAIDLRRVTDLALMVYVGAVSGTTPSLTVSLGIYDAAGNLFPAVMSTAALSTAGSKVAYAGLFSGGTSQIVFPEWAQVAWTITGTSPSFSGVEISLYGR